jgi:hypothetical protein
MATAERDSRAALDGFLARSLEQRFAALEEGAAQLLPEHRRELLNSLREKTDGPVRLPARAVVQHASWFAVWRGRLPFQIHGLARNSLLVLCVGTALVLSYRRTSLSWAEIQNREDIAASWVLSDGRIVGDRLVAGHAYAVMRLASGMAELRDWRPGEGYAEARVPANWLRTRVDPKPR